MNKVVAGSMNGSHLGRLISKDEIAKTTGLLPLQGHFWYGIITNIQHTKDGSVTILLGIPPKMQDLKKLDPSRKPRARQHHLYLSQDQEIELVAS
jgi:hypothetical protein